MDTRLEAGRISALDGWRGIAIALVLWGHFFPVPGVNLGMLGVEFFFVLSGRLMADILFVKKFPLPEFFWRRASRIMPALIVFLLAAFLIAPLFHKSFSPFWIISSMTFTINYVMTLSSYYPMEWLQQLWSLCVEEHGYLLLGLIVFIFGRGRWKPVAAIAVIGLFSMIDGADSIWGLHQNLYDAYGRTDAHVSSIFVSVLIYLMLRHRVEQAWVKTWALPLVVLGTGAGVLLSFDAVPIPLRYTLGTASLAVAVALVDVAGKRLNQILSLRPLTGLGMISFSLYLYQEPFYHAAEDTGQFKLAYLAAALMTAIASYYLVEQPARRALNKLWKRMREKRSPEPAIAMAGDDIAAPERQSQA